MVNTKSKPTYYKAVRPNGTSFHDHTTVWKVGATLVHPNPGRVGGREAGGYFSIATTVTDCTGMAWPCRVFEVEPVGESWAPHTLDLPNKVACHSVKVIREIDATLVLGPQGPELVRLIERIAALPVSDINNLGAAWDAAWDAAWGAAWGAARDAARGVSVRDLIGQHGFTQEHYDLLTGPWRKAVGRLHADDVDLMVGE